MVDKARLQRLLDAAWRTRPAWCEAEGLPRSTAGLDAWALFCLEAALNDKGGSNG